ncbi:hypothetical protein BH11PSE12_BH11PSE12_03270 [soil metagenome]
MKNWQLTALLSIPTAIVWGWYRGESTREIAIRTLVVVVLAGGGRYLLDRITSGRSK